MSWFERLMGFAETSAEDVRSNIVLDGEYMRSLRNGRRFRHGHLEVPSLAELRTHSTVRRGRTRIRQIVADVSALHTDPTNRGALFQVASQFNLLEMVHPNRTPEHGVGGYEHDHTQGPACAIAAGAGTIYRNYFVSLDGQTGQTASKQIDCLAGVGALLGNSANRLWTMQNGYALASEQGLREIASRLASSERDHLRATLRVGLQRETQVTIDGCEHAVSQIYGSALPVAYSQHPASLWEPFARLVLEASYEATLCAAVREGNNSVYLTLLGGGAFGNAASWIVDAMERALRLHEDSGLEVVVVNFRELRPDVDTMIKRL